jgi:hypothetical protein
MQAYLPSHDPSMWRFRWVRAQTNLPEKGAPYTVLGDVNLEDSRPLGSLSEGGMDKLLRQLASSDAMAESAAQGFDISQYEYVGVHHKSGAIDRMVYHLEPRKDLPPELQEELWEALCSSPAVPAEHRLSEEDCQVRRWFREAQSKMK